MDGGNVMKRNKLIKIRKAIEVFSGSGGLSTGIIQAGFEVVAAIEINKTATESYILNHPNVKIINDDVCNVSGTKLIKNLGIRKGSLDLLAGCSPCQGFSRLKKDDGKPDPRNLLVLEFVRLVQEIMPRTIIMENVPGLLNSEEGQAIFHQTKQKLESLGYHIDYKVINAVDYGVPQYRRRTVILGSKLKKINVKLPEYTHRNPKNNSSNLPVWKTVVDAIGDVPSVDNGQSHPDIPYHVATKNDNLNLERIRYIPPNGGSRTSLPDRLVLNCHKKYPNGFKDVYGRMTWEKPSPTLTGGCTNITKGRFIHPEQNRAITLHEAKLLQSFPNDYKFAGNRTEIAQQIGNAVPVRLGYIMANKLKIELDKKY